MLVGLWLLILVILCLAAGISVGLAMSSFLRRVRRAISILFSANVIILIVVLGFSGGSSISFSGVDLFLYIPISIIAAMLSGLLSVASSLAIERIVGYRLMFSNAKQIYGGIASNNNIPKYIIVAFVLSLSLGFLSGGAIDPGAMLPASQILLLALMIIVGIDLGADPEMLRSSIAASLRCWHVWLGAILGSLFSGILVAIVFGVRVSLASSLAMGWYTYIASYVYALYGAQYSIYAFLQNYFREMLTYIVLPLLSRSFRSVSLIAFGGVTTMDNTLPAVISTLGREYTFAAISSGIVLTMLVPLIVPVIDSLWAR